MDSQGNEPNNPNNYIFSDEAVENISALVDLLRQIRERLKAENIDINSFVEPKSIPRKKPKRKGCDKV